VCVYYCSTYYKAVRVGGGGEDMCATRDDEPRPLWTKLNWQPSVRRFAGYD
jgi:hypothetical protein